MSHFEEIIGNELCSSFKINTPEMIYYPKNDRTKDTRAKSSSFSNDVIRHKSRPFFVPIPFIISSVRFPKTNLRLKKC